MKTLRRGCVYALLGFMPPAIATLIVATPTIWTYVFDGIFIGTCLMGIVIATLRLRAEAAR